MWYDGTACKAETAGAPTIASALSARMNNCTHDNVEAMVVVITPDSASSWRLRITHFHDLLGPVCDDHELYTRLSLGEILDVVESSVAVKCTGRVLYSYDQGDGLPFD